MWLRVGQCGKRKGLVLVQQLGLVNRVTLAYLRVPPTSNLVGRLDLPFDAVVAELHAVEGSLQSLL